MNWTEEKINEFAEFTKKDGAVDPGRFGQKVTLWGISQGLIPYNENLYNVCLTLGEGELFCSIAKAYRLHHLVAKPESYGCYTLIDTESTSFGNICAISYLYEMKEDIDLVVEDVDAVALFQGWAANLLFPEDLNIQEASTILGGVKEVTPNLILSPAAHKAFLNSNK